MKKLLAVTALTVLCVPTFVLAQSAATRPATTQPAATSQTQPSSFKTEMEKVSYAIGLNIAKGTKQQMPEANVDMLTQGLKDGLAGTSDVDKASYGMGASIARTMKQQVSDVNADQLSQGIKDGIGGNAKLNEQEAMQTLMAFSQTMRAKQEQKAAEAGKENKEKGEAFLAKNAKEEGVKVTPSGLQYKVIKAGTGPKPTATDTVEVKYRGTLIDGTEFDSSKDKTVTFPVSNVIAGWTEALQLMPVGSKYQLFIPSNLAYGERQASPQITSNSTLLFDVELVSIKSAASQPASMPAE